MKLELNQISVQYGKSTPVLGDVSLTVDQGDLVSIYGPSGSGKSTLLRTINQLQPPSSGEILVDECPADELHVPTLRRQIAYLHQTPVMFPGTVLTNFQRSFGFRASGGSRCPDDAALRQRMDELLLQDVDLTTSAETLSVGQKQRVALLRAMMLKPRILLCDEPTSALDAESREFVEKHLININREENVSIVLVTHITTRLCQSAQKFYLRNGSLAETES